jgi:enoyl-CoA hydratase/carnithine racemase
MTSDPILLRHTDGAVARLILNDPGRANVLSAAMMAQLSAALADLAADPAVHVIVLAASGRIFCAGHDLAELQAADTAAHAALFAQCAELMQQIVNSPKPVIARVQGAAVAAGCQLVASCDLAYSVDTAKFAVSGVNLGLFCSTPGVALGRAVNRKAALEMLLTGRFVSAPEAAAMGLINRCVPAADLDAAIDEAAQAIAAKAPDAIALGKRVFGRQVELPLAQAYGVASAGMVENLGLACAKTGIEDFLKG